LSRGAYDEAIGPGGVPRPDYAQLLGALERLDLFALSSALADGLRERDVTFRLEGKDDPFRLDAVPRLIESKEWAPLAAGLSQRVRALERFVADVYAAREIVTAGVVPARAVDSCDHYEPLAARFPETPVRVGVAGLDVVRDPDGRFLVLEDNVRTPSGFAYVFPAREALDRHLPGRLADGRVPYDAAIDLLARSLRAAAPEGVGDPSIVLLSDGPSSAAWYEHERIARMLDIPLVGIGDLSVRGGRLVARTGNTRIRVDVVYRRTDEDRLTDEGRELTEVGAALFEPLSRGTLACVNAFGAGVADDKLIHAYVEDMVRFYLGEEPLLSSVRTYDPGIREHRDEIVERIEELVVKPRAGSGGHGVVVGPHAEAGDLRGITRVALDRGALVVNSSQRGGAKDTWVMA
jgi:uncharacterized circularly permuted ATP-grasp superfamily protein